MKLRRNGSREAVIRQLCACGTDPKDAEKMVPVPKPGTVDRRVSLSPEQADVFVRAVKREIADPSVRACLLLMLYTGLRISEATHLMRDNLRLEGGRPVIVVIGKGRKPRTVPVSRRALGVLTAFVPVRKDKGTGYLFPNTRGTGPVPAARVQAACRLLAEREPALRGMTPHVLRHTHMTLALQNCHDIKSIVAAAGHGNGKGRKLPLVTLTYLHPR